jgi:hypothetical protein
MDRRLLILLLVPLVLSGCERDEVSFISIRNQTELPIYAQPYSTDYTNGDWIQPGLVDEFYSIECDCLNGFKYFSFYYDSLIVHLKDHEDEPIKFFKDGTTVNYDPSLNPFINKDVWKVRLIERSMPGKIFKSNYENRQVIEHYFCISSDCITSLKNTKVQESNSSD